MKPRIKVITLGVDDLERSLSFYRDGLGMPTKGIVGTEYEVGAVVFIDMNDNLILALYPRKALAKDAGVPEGPRSVRRRSRWATWWIRRRTSTRSCSRPDKQERG